jgi:hypothetical protein
LYEKSSENNLPKRKPLKVKKRVNLLSGSIKIPQPKTFPGKFGGSVALTGNLENWSFPVQPFVEIVVMVYKPLNPAMPTHLKPKIVPSCNRPTRHLINKF